MQKLDCGLVPFFGYENSESFSRLRFNMYRSTYDFFHNSFELLGQFLVVSDKNYAKFLMLNVFINDTEEIFHR